MTGNTTYDETVGKLAERIAWADRVVVGTGSAARRASGLDFYFERDEVFNREFGVFAKRYGFRNVDDGLKFDFSVEEDHWAFLATHSHVLQQAAVGQIYLDLQKALEGKECHFVTMNQDGQLAKVFGDEHVSAIQGDYRYLQCFHQCHDKLYPAPELMEELYGAIDNGAIPTDLIPKCPECGVVLEPWVGGYHFLEGEQYKAEYGKWEDFLLSSHTSKVLFLEIGVGRKRKELIRQPFWQFALGWADAGFYANISPDNALCPMELEGHSLALEYDIARVLHDLSR